jgi:hypothetical protein
LELKSRVAVALRKFRRSLSQRGIAATLARACSHGWDVLTTRSSEISTYSPDFDARHGVDTARMVDLSELKITNDNWIYATSYEPLRAPERLECVLRSLPVTYEDSVFVDFGSGKGRALLVASRFPFRSIIGVEFLEELHKIAEGNIRACAPQGNQCADIRSVCMDVSDFEIPQTPLVAYLFNPFVPPVLDHLVANLRCSLLQVPRTCFVVYFKAKYASVFEAAGFQRIHVLEDGVIYQWPFDE